MNLLLLIASSRQDAKVEAIVEGAKSAILRPAARCISTIGWI